MKKTVNANLLLTHVPATKPPEYSISEGVNLIPINKLAEIKVPWEKYVVIGAGKTGLDALLYLIDNNVNPDRIVWIVSNDCWYVNRDVLADDLKKLGDYFPLCMNVVLESENVNDAYCKLEEIDMLMRLDKNIWPTKMRMATISSNEMDKIRKVKNIVRQGRIKQIDQDEITFTNEVTYPTSIHTLHIDCSAAGTNFPPVKKIYDGDQIYLQILGAFHPTGVIGASASAAFIAAIELR